MATNDNSVNIKDEKLRYHHGDLRAALVAEGLRLLAASDVENISLREIARNVGVSATAVYRHFPDKQALIAALARAGAEQLAREQIDAQAAAGGGMAGFDATGRAYVRFALANPALFRLINIETYLDDTSDDFGLALIDGRRLLSRNVAELAAPGTSKDVQRVRAIRSWAMVHGLAMLMLDGKVPPDDALIDQVVEARAIHAFP